MQTIPQVFVTTTTPISWVQHPIQGGSVTSVMFATANGGLRCVCVRARARMCVCVMVCVGVFVCVRAWCVLKCDPQPVGLVWVVLLRARRTGRGRGGGGGGGCHA